MASCDCGGWTAAKPLIRPPLSAQTAPSADNTPSIEIHVMILLIYHLKTCSSHCNLIVFRFHVQIKIFDPPAEPPAFRDLIWLIARAIHRIVVASAMLGHWCSGALEITFVSYRLGLVRSLVGTSAGSPFKFKTKRHDSMPRPSRPQPAFWVYPGGPALNEAHSTQYS